jgi:hypothetical protein
LFGVLVRESGVACPVCGTARCARPHAWRYRKRVRDLSTGEVFERVPIRRARFCDGSTVSLPPGELWRGRATVSSVLETVVWVLRDGVERAYEWTLFAGTGESVVSCRTLRRWRQWVLGRLVGSAWAWLGPRLGGSWSDRQDAAGQLETVLDRLTESLLLAFRAATGRAVLDKPTPPPPPAPCPSRRVAGRLAASPPHDPSSPLRPRGSWWARRRRGPPPPHRPGGSGHD